MERKKKKYHLFIQLYRSSFRSRFFCARAVFSAPKKCSIQVPMLLFVPRYRITYYQIYAPRHQGAFNMGTVYCTEKVFLIPTFGIHFKFLSRSVKSAHNILPQLIFYLTRLRTGTSGRREHLLLASPLRKNSVMWLTWWPFGPINDVFLCRQKENDKK